MPDKTFYSSNAEQNKNEKERKKEKEIERDESKWKEI